MKSTTQNNCSAVESMLRNWRFRKKTDDLGIYCKGNTFYYKEIDKQLYLVFNHFSKVNSRHEAFDCYLVVYQKRTHVGSQKPAKIEVLKLSFTVDLDFPLIADYLKKFKARTSNILHLHCEEDQEYI